MAAAPSTHDQQIVIAPGLMREADTGCADIHNDAYADARRRSAEPLIDAGGDEGFGLPIE